MSEYGNLPQHAIERLKNRSKTFTSDLSVNEFLLVKEAGFEPLEMVMGSTIYHIGFQRSKWSQNEEMKVLTQAMYHARELAMSKMEAEAEMCGADGVVGVRLIINRYEWGEDLAEFMAVGTAVKHKDHTKNFRNNKGKPFTSDLSGQDFWTLLQAGYRPLEMVMGNCVYHVAHQGLLQSLKQIGQNCEMTNYTQALYDARELAMERMEQEAHEQKAEGIVGVRLDPGHHWGGSHVIEYFAVGTAITPMSSEHEIQKPQIMLSLND